MLSLYFFNFYTLPEEYIKIELFVKHWNMQNYLPTLSQFPLTLATFANSMKEQIVHGVQLSQGSLLWHFYAGSGWRDSLVRVSY
jgi:hypothetical protein